jgi:DNA replication initiation complex subunit (GINS family)
LQLLLFNIFNGILSKGDIMTYQAIIQREIETLPPQYYSEVVDFIGYLRHKAQQTTIQAGFQEQIQMREIECINRHAEELNKEMEDVLIDQSFDI